MLSIGYTAVNRTECYLFFKIKGICSPKKECPLFKHLTPCQQTQTNHFNSCFECDPSELLVINQKPLEAEQRPKEVLLEGKSNLDATFLKSITLLTHAKLTAEQRL